MNISKINFEQELQKMSKVDCREFANQISKLGVRKPSGIIADTIEKSASEAVAPQTYFSKIKNNLMSKFANNFEKYYRLGMLDATQYKAFTLMVGDLLSSTVKDITSIIKKK